MATRGGSRQVLSMVRDAHAGTDSGDVQLMLEVLGNTMQHPSALEASVPTY